VLVARTGDEALLLAEQLMVPIDLLLTDVVMPGMSGRRLADQLLVSRPGTPVLFVSGYTDDEIARHGVLEEGVQLLEKPFTPQSLLQRVRAVMMSGVARAAHKAAIA
jgi:two-component system cell cycle sensor histidine kinase/response regulator CckA